MVAWRQVEQDAPRFAARVRERFDAGTNKTIATLRRDGAPRISGTELQFVEGEVVLGMMGGSMKLRDVRRDPRVAVHSPSVEPPHDDPSAWPGDAKLAGTVVETGTVPEAPGGAGSSFRIDITEVTLTYVGSPADHIVIESWHPGRGHESRIRR
jgi:hypothetical protein